MDLWSPLTLFYFIWESGGQGNHITSFIIIGDYGFMKYEVKNKNEKQPEITVEEGDPGRSYPLVSKGGVIYIPLLLVSG